MAVIILLSYSFPTSSLLPWSMLILMIIIMLMFTLKKINTTAQFTLISLIAIMAHLIIYNNFYPILLEYDSGKKAGEFLKKEKQNLVISYDYNFDEADKLDYETNSYSLEFYSEKLNKIIYKQKDLIPFKGKNYWIYTSEKEMLQLKKNGWIKDFKIMKHMNTSRINIDFFLPNKRNTTTEKKYLIKI